MGSTHGALLNKVMESRANHEIRRLSWSVCAGQGGSAVVETSPKSRHVLIAVQAGLAFPCQLVRVRPLPLQLQSSSPSPKATFQRLQL